ncbi:MAG TPA: hypothetical protein PLA50_08275 [Bacteroidia bacterium]|nr:hypothetical protein [Bacteroidia bacterium]
MKTIQYGSQAVPVIERQWNASPRRPYRKTYRLKPGQRWGDAEETTDQWETYVVVGSDGYEPAGATVARELIGEGASVAVFTELWAGTAVFVDHHLVCRPVEGRLAEVINRIRNANDGKLGGLPDVIGLFDDGRIAMREIKNIDSKDRIGAKQHALADLMRELFQEQLDLQVVEWGGTAPAETDRKLIGGGEGYAIYTDKCDGKFRLILDSSTAISMLSEEDAKGLTGVRIMEFSSEQERSDYLKTIRYRPEEE